MSERLMIVVCPVCKRKEFSNIALKPGHYYRGSKCPGVPESIIYVPARIAALDKTEAKPMLRSRQPGSSARVSDFLSEYRDKAEGER